MSNLPTNDAIIVSGGSITMATANNTAISGGEDNDTVELSGLVSLVGIVDGGLGTDTLRFSMAIPGSPAQLAAINSALSGADPAGGGVTIGGQNYTWVNFETIEAAATIQSIPTLGTWALLLMILLLSGIAASQIRTNRTTC